MDLVILERMEADELLSLELFATVPPWRRLDEGRSVSVP